MTEMERDIYNRAAAHYMKKHVFPCVKLQSADCGNSLPTTLHATARDLFEEGALQEFWDDYFDGNELFEPKFGEFGRHPDMYATE